MGRLSIASFLAHGNPFHLYCYEPIEDAPDGTVVCDANDILPRDQVFSYQSGFGKGSVSGGSNFFRYKLLLERGGWWVDTDVICLQPFDFPSEHVLASEVEAAASGAVVAASCVIKQPANSPLMRYAWRKCRQKDPNRLQWGEVGPRLLFDSIQALGYEDYLQAPAVFNPIPHYRWNVLIEPQPAWSPGPETHAVHLWHQMWRSNGANPDALFPEGCLYEQFKRRYLGS
jgi:hypothetical protein